jgi:hypothetical protein
LTRGLIFIAVISLVPLILVWIIANGLRTGIIKSRGGPVLRSDHPIFFWVMIGLYLGCIAMFIYFFGGLALGAFRGGR